MKGFVGLVFAALCLLVPTIASANHSGGNGPDYDKVDGTVEDLFPSTLHINAISNADGTEPRGHFWYELPAEAPGTIVAEVAGEVTCLRVVGNMASIGVRIDRDKLPGFPGEGQGMLFHVTDMGEPGDLDTHLDIFTLVPPTVCPLPILFPFLHDSGNYIVHDATP
jgi:hypothetical protein